MESQIAPNSARPTVSTPNRIVVKIGSALIAGEGHLCTDSVRRLVEDVAALRAERGCEVMLVVSGAVAAGLAPLSWADPPQAVVKRQAAASVGQPLLIAAFAGAFASMGLSVAQILLTAEDIEDRRRFLSARHTLLFLLSQGVIPIINENDAVSDDERKVGDNDHLAALVAQLGSAEMLVLLSQVEGILQDQGRGPRISEVRDPGLLRPHLHGGQSKTGVGGMVAKVSAARHASRAGIAAVIADGRCPGLLLRIHAGEDVGTRFVPDSLRTVDSNPGIAIQSRSWGSIQLDRAAELAL